MIRVLFIGTMNTYRSRFAEIYLNHISTEDNLPITSYSVGFETNSSSRQLLDLDTLEYCKKLDIPIASLRTPTQVMKFHFENFDHVIAMDETEHREMMRAYFPEWENKISYWMVHNKEYYSYEKALEKLKANLDHFIEQEILAYH